MTTTASIVFSSFTSAADPMPRAWIRFRDQLTVDSHEASVAPGEQPSADRQTRSVCVWRLLASNNRELGRSAVLYDSFDEARSAVFTARLTSSEWEIRSVHGPNAGTHGWFAGASDSFPVLTCGRWYGAHGASIEAAQHSLDAFQSATILAEGHRRLSPDRRRSVHEPVSPMPLGAGGGRTRSRSLG